MMVGPGPASIPEAGAEIGILSRQKVTLRKGSDTFN